MDDVLSYSGTQPTKVPIFGLVPSCWRRGGMARSHQTKPTLSDIFPNIPTSYPVPRQTRRGKNAPVEGPPSLSGRADIIPSLLQTRCWKRTVSCSAIGPVSVANEFFLCRVLLATCGSMASIIGGLVIDQSVDGIMAACMCGVAAAAFPRLPPTCHIARLPVSHASIRVHSAQCLHML